MMDIEKEREKFEGYMDDSYPCNESEKRLIWEGWQAAKQDEMTEERAREILEPYPKCTMSGAIRFKKEDCYINSKGNLQPLLHIGSENEVDISLEKMKAIIWWMENKA